MRFQYAAMLCVFFCAQQANACSLNTGTKPFAPSQTAAANDDGGLKAPVAEVVNVTRGIGAGNASCDDKGLLSVRVAWPRGTDYKARDLGFEFRVVSGASAYSIFPEGQVSGRVDGRDSEFLFLWRDDAPAQQQPIQLEVEVRAVTQDNRRGPPARFTLHAAPGA